VSEEAWWRSFGDPTLTSLIERATRSNLDVREAVLRIAEARAQRDVAAAPLWPSLSGSAGYTRERISERLAFSSLLGSLGGAPTRGAPSGGVRGAIPGLVNPFNQYQYGFDASWEIDLFGRTRRAVEAAGADTDAALASGRDVLVSMLAELARTYVDLRVAQRRLAILEESLVTERDTLELTRDRRTAGLTNELDVENAAVQVTTTESQLPPARSRITTDINTLSFLLALEPGALRSELATTAPVPPVPAQVPIGMPADVIRRRPDIRAAEAQLHAATAREGVAVADLFPRLTLDASGGFLAEHPTDLTVWASRFFSVGPAIELPIFSGGRLQASVRLANVRVKEAAVTYARTVLAALEDVENALAVYGPEQSRRASLEATVAHSREALALARQRYESGVTSFLDVLVAERNLQQSQLALADSTAAVATDLIALYKALGGGWSGAVPAGGPDDSR
jgi:NodT family efflux transporter outer membrane factor (OMF) lipoprotein